MHLHFAGGQPEQQRKAAQASGVEDLSNHLAISPPLTTGRLAKGHGIARQQGQTHVVPGLTAEILEYCPALQPCAVGF